MYACYQIVIQLVLLYDNMEEAWCQSLMQGARAALLKPSSEEQELRVPAGCFN